LAWREERRHSVHRGAAGSPASALLARVDLPVAAVAQQAGPPQGANVDPDHGDYLPGREVQALLTSVDALSAPSPKLLEIQQASRSEAADPARLGGRSPAACGRTLAPQLEDMGRCGAASAPS
jgi:hypothetical protein